MLDGGCFMRAGWVHQLKLYPFSIREGERFIAIGKVKHSQQTSATFLLPWIAVQKSGKILAAHCTCMAGLGEACSHVAAIISYLINATKVRRQSRADSCTSNLCGWNHSAKEVKPAFLTDIHSYGQGSRKRSMQNASKGLVNKRTACSHIETTSKSGPGDTSQTDEIQTNEPTEATIHTNEATVQINKVTSQTSQTHTTNSPASETNETTDATSPASEINETTEGTSQTSETQSDKTATTGAATEEQEARCFAKLNLAIGKAVILRLVSPYAKDLAPKATLPSYPKPITDLYDPAALLLTYPNLLTECQRVYALCKNPSLLFITFWLTGLVWVPTLAKVIVDGCHVFSYGLLLSSGDKWFRHRKLLTPAFHFDILKSYVSIANEVTHTLLDMWQEHADKRTTFDVSDYSSLYTLDILLRCAFSDHSSNCLFEKNANPYVKAVHEITKTFVPRVVFPPYHYDWIFNFSPLGRKFHHYAKIIHDYSEKAIKKRREQLLANSADLSKKHVDFLDVLLSAKDEDGNGLTDVEVREEVNTFMFEGHDTTASGLNWILYCLATNPDHQEKCRSEAREMLSDNDNITWENLNKLEYITMCIKESLRLYPSVPVIARQLTDDYVFKDYHIQKGTLISINVQAHHRLPQLWPDPEKYDPLRFTTENIKARDSFVYTPFSAGPRNCIGQHLAMDELKIAVAHIVNRFYIEVDPSHKIERLYSITLKAKYGIMLKLSSV